MLKNKPGNVVFCLHWCGSMECFSAEKNHVSQKMSGILPSIQLIITFTRWCWGTLIEVCKEIQAQNFFTKNWKVMSNAMESKLCSMSPIFYGNNQTSFNSCFFKKKFSRKKMSHFWVIKNGFLIVDHCFIVMANIPWVFCVLWQQGSQLAVVSLEGERYVFFFSINFFALLLLFFCLVVVRRHLFQLV